MLQSLSCSNPVARLMGLLNYLKNFRHNSEPEQFSFKVPLTRQEMANLTGLCVETVIRNIKSLARKKVVTIKNHKVYY